jgi:hypothetical protein
VATKKKSGSKKSGATKKDLKASVKKLRAKLDRADAKAERWKGVARRHEKAAAEAQATVKELRKRLDEASSAGSGTEAEPETAAPASPSAAPDESWTVVRLRAEARSRGLTGFSGKSKAELLDVLS